jgi:hypothetical protein
VNLVEPPVPQVKPPSRLGIDTSLRLRPWSAARLTAIFRDAQRYASADSLEQARHARHCLSSFWLAAPVDQLGSLYAGDLGELQRSMLAGPLPLQALAADELQWRDQLTRQLQQQADAPERVNVLLALMPYYPPQGMQMEDPIEQVPDWLLRDYASYCDPELKARLQQPAGYLQPSPPADAASVPALVPVPVLSERRGEEAMAWFEQAEAVNRMAALINLYSLDPADQPTRAELAGLRSTIAQLWLDVNPEQLEQLYRTAVGTVFRSLIVSGFSGELVDGDDAEARRALAAQVDDLSQPRAINSLLAALLYFPAGKVSFEGGLEFIPDWLRQELAAMAAAQP